MKKYPRATPIHPAWCSASCETPCSGATGALRSTRRPAPRGSAHRCRVLGTQNIPRQGCYVITPNHYYRPGFGSQWSSLAISATVPADVRWVMTGELTFPGSWIAPLGRPVSRFALGRIAKVYDFITMPPMPPRPRDVERRAAAVRGVLRHVTYSPDAVIAMAPEGGDQPGGCLCMPPSGAGQFCLLLAAAGLHFLPVGVYEAEGALTLNFGEPYVLTSPPGEVHSGKRPPRRLRGDEPHRASDPARSAGRVRE